MKCYNLTSFNHIKAKTTTLSIKLPKYTIHTTAYKPKKLKRNFLVLIIAITISLLAGYLSSSLYADNAIKTLSTRNEVLEEQNTDNQNKLIQLETELNLLKTEKKVKQQAITLLQGDYKKAIDNQNELKSEISFYERLLSPNTQNKGLRVFEVKVNEPLDELYKIKVILVQKIERAKEISGSYQILLIGTQNNLPKTIQINDKAESSFTFKYFHHISLDFSMPEGFKPLQLVVKLLPKNKKNKTTDYTVDWHSLIG